MENYKKESLDLVDILLCSRYDNQPFCFNPQEMNKKMVKSIDEWNGICEELKYYPIFLIYISHDIDENVIRENEDQFDWTLLSSCQSGFSEEFLNEYKEDNKYPYVVHAELNAILNAHKDLRGSILYTTLSPCKECCKAIIQAGIKEVVYLHEFEHDDIVRKKMFDHAGVFCRQYRNHTDEKKELTISLY